MKALLLLLFLPLAAMANALQSADAKRAPADQRTAAQRWADLAKAEAPSFRRHVVPLFSRAGCSGRECHGAFAGQGGFQLSLFGYDFDKDHKEMVADAEDGSRIDLKKPTDSLILTKPSLDRGETHKGKKRFDKGSWEYNLVLRWIQGGAKLDVAETGEFDRLEIAPQEIVFKKAGDTAQLRVMAHWKDGKIEDVTQLTRFRTNDDSVADVSATGMVTCKEKGDTHIVAFYDNGVHPVPVMLPASAFTAAKFPKVPTRTKVDELVVNKLRKAGIVPSEICTDSEFLRRVSLDLAATLPGPDEVRAFLADKSPDKRAKKVEELLKSPGYSAWWTTLMCDFSGNTPQQLNNGGDLQLNAQFSRQWYDWIQKRITDNMPYDQLVAGMVLATSRSTPEQGYEDFAKEMASYFRVENRADFASRPDMPYFWQRQNVRKPQEKALAFAHTFLGVRIECAECHKHPFDQWTQTDFKQFQAFFEPVSYGSRRTDEAMNYATLTKELQEKLGYDRKKQTNRNEYRKKLGEMLRAGEVLPWQEVFVNPPKDKKALSEKDLARLKQKNPTFDGRVFTPKILGGDEVMLTKYPDPRGPLMEWLRGKDNPYFAQAFVNRAWAVYFGRGIVEPADDMNLANPPSNKELMDFLAAGFVKSGYDMKWLHRTIVNSDTYQRSWKTTPSNKLDGKNFSHALIRRLPAEMVFDSIAMATASASGQARFVADVDNRAIGPNATISGKTKGGDSYTLKTFGKPARIMNCDCERSSDPTLLQTIYTRNDPSLLALLDSSKRDGVGWIEELRRSTSPEFSREKLEAEMAKSEAGKQRVQQTLAELAAKQQVVAEKDRQKYEGQIKELDQRIDRTKAELVSAIARKPVDFDRVIEEVFLRTVSRPPTKDEFARAKADLGAAATPVDGVRELLWAMLNTREFMVNH
ncbi:MAG: DUF1549 domain-containing protein [Chthoniobacteraceae bacterium]